MNEIKEYRADGWPLCPNCGEDELWSRLVWDGNGERPPLEEYLKAVLRCYHCGWSNEPPIIRRFRFTEWAALAGDNAENDYYNSDDYYTEFYSDMDQP